MELVGNTQGQSHRADGGGTLKEGLRKQNGLQLADTQSGNQEHRPVEDGDHQGPQNHLLGNLPAVAVYLVVSFESGPDRQQQNRQGRGLDAAGRGGRRAAHQHQADGQQFGTAVELSQIHGVKARRPR